MIKGFSQSWICKFFSSYLFAIVLVGLGIFLQLNLYLENRSLVVDEAWVAVDIVSSSLQEISLGVPIFEDLPRSPLGFSVLTKLSTLLIGNHEYALRFIPICSGVLSLIVFFLFLKRFYNSQVTVLAVALLALSPGLIRYATLLKQYASDVLMTLILYWMVGSVLRRGASWGRLVTLGIGGAVTIWISNACMFVLAGLGTALMGSAIFQRNWKKVWLLLIPFAFWLASFILLYQTSLKHMVQNNWLVGIWEVHFMPMPFSMTSLVWLKDSFLEMFRDPAGLHPQSFAAFLFLMGCFIEFRNSKERFFMFFLPLVFTIGGAILHKYPFAVKFLVFLLPTICIFIAQGASYLIRRLPKFSFLVVVIILPVLFVSPIKKSIGRFFNSSNDQVLFIKTAMGYTQNRPVMEYFQEHYQKGDFIFMNNAAQYAFWYYTTYRGFLTQLATEPMGNWKGTPHQAMMVGHFIDALNVQDGVPFTNFRYVFDVYNEQGFFRDTLVVRDKSDIQIIIENSPNFFKAHARTWLFISHLEPKAKNFILSYFDRHGRRLKAFEDKGASIYLYKF